MADDDVDHDLIEFMRAYMAGTCRKTTLDATLGVLESAERIYDVSLPEHAECKFLTPSLLWTFQ